MNDPPRGVGRAYSHAAAAAQAGKAAKGHKSGAKGGLLRYGKWMSRVPPPACLSHLRTLRNNGHENFAEYFGKAGKTRLMALKLRQCFAFMNVSSGVEGRLLPAMIMAERVICP